MLQNKYHIYDVIITDDVIRLHYTLTFTNCSVPVVYRATIYNKRSKCPPPESVLRMEHVWSWTVTDFGKSQARGGCLQFRQAQQKWVGEAPLFHFWLELNALTVLRPHTKYIRDWVQANLGVHHKNWLPKYINIKDFRYLAMGKSNIKFIQEFQVHSV